MPSLHHNNKQQNIHFQLTVLKNEAKKYLEYLSKTLCYIQYDVTYLLVQQRYESLKFYFLCVFKLLRNLFFLQQELSIRNGILDASLIEKCLYIYTGVSIQRPERGAQLLGGDVAVTVLEQRVIVIIVINMQDCRLDNTVSNKLNTSFALAS